MWIFNLITLPITVETCVCWSIISETQTEYPRMSSSISSPFDAMVRHGSVRLLALYHFNRFSLMELISWFPSFKLKRCDILQVSWANAEDVSTRLFFEHIISKTTIFYHKILLVEDTRAPKQKWLITTVKSNIK